MADKMHVLYLSSLQTDFSTRITALVSYVSGSFTRAFNVGPTVSWLSRFAEVWTCWRSVNVLKISSCNQLILHTLWNVDALASRVSAWVSDFLSLMSRVVWAVLCTHYLRKPVPLHLPPISTLTWNVLLCMTTMVAVVFSKGETKQEHG